MAQHMISTHSKDELWNWSISYERIAVFLNQNVTTKSSKLPVQKMEFHKQEEDIVYYDDE